MIKTITKYDKFGNYMSEKDTSTKDNLKGRPNNNDKHKTQTKS
jgi:hypothetical protein